MDELRVEINNLVVTISEKAVTFKRNGLSISVTIEEFYTLATALGD